MPNTIFKANTLKSYKEQLDKSAIGEESQQTNGQSREAECQGLAAAETSASVVMA